MGRCPRPFGAHVLGGVIPGAALANSLAPGYFPASLQDDRGLSNSPVQKLIWPIVGAHFSLLLTGVARCAILFVSNQRISSSKERRHWFTGLLITDYWFTGY
jgi:hypothetical protein